MAKAIQMDAKRIRRLNRELWLRDREHAKDAAYKIGFDSTDLKAREMRKLKQVEDEINEARIREALDDAAWSGHYE